MSLKGKLAIRMALGMPLLMAMMFAPAGSFRFWQGWVFIGIFALFNLFFVVYFYRRDPELIERRLKRKEDKPEQRRFQKLWMPFWIAALLLPGFDYRFGWSAGLGGVPVWLTALAQVSLAGSWLVIFEVFRFNSFASAVIQVEKGQRVIDTGPYRLVRHPMYSGIVLMLVSTPFALGSYVSIPPAILLIPVLIYRLVHEEEVLRRELPGYTGYCERTRFRLIPRVY